MERLALDPIRTLLAVAKVVIATISIASPLLGLDLLLNNGAMIAAIQLIGLESLGIGLVGMATSFAILMRLQSVRQRSLALVSQRDRILELATADRTRYVRVLHAIHLVIHQARTDVRGSMVRTLRNIRNSRGGRAPSLAARSDYERCVESFCNGVSNAMSDFKGAPVHTTIRISSKDGSAGYCARNSGQVSRERARMDIGRDDSISVGLRNLAKGARQMVIQNDLPEDAAHWIDDLGTNRGRFYRNVAAVPVQCVWGTDEAPIRIGELIVDSLDARFDDTTDFQILAMLADSIFILSMTYELIEHLPSGQGRRVNGGTFAPAAGSGVAIDAGISLA